MSDINVVPGQTGQPPKSVQELGYPTPAVPQVDYYMQRRGNPLQETTPLQGVPTSTDSKKPGMPRTTQEINGGRTMQTGGGVG